MIRLYNDAKRHLLQSAEDPGGHHLHRAMLYYGVACEVTPYGCELYKINYLDTTPMV